MHSLPFWDTLAPHLAPLVKNFGAMCQRGGGQESNKVPSPASCSLALVEENSQVGVAWEVGIGDSSLFLELSL